MLYAFLKRIERVISIKSVSAHCDIPCKIYDPSGAQIAALSVIRFIDLIEETARNQSNFKQPQFEQFPDTHSLVHRIMLTGSACKQHIDRQKGLELLALVNEFAASFWATKGIETMTAKCPYPPAEDTIYPIIK